MIAKPNDDLRIAEMHAVILEIRARLDELDIAREDFITPKTAVMRNTADGLHSCVFRLAEEASNLEYSTMNQFPTVPWDDIRGIRNRLAHDYGGVDPEYIWDIAHGDLDVLENVCKDYAAARSLKLGI